MTLKHTSGKDIYFNIMNGKSTNSLSSTSKSRSNSPIKRDASTDTHDLVSSGSDQTHQGSTRYQIHLPKLSSETLLPTGEESGTNWINEIPFVPSSSTSPIQKWPIPPTYHPEKCHFPSPVVSPQRSEQQDIIPQPKYHSPTPTMGKSSQWNQQIHERKLVCNQNHIDRRINNLPRHYFRSSNSLEIGQSRAMYCHDCHVIVRVEMI